MRLTRLQKIFMESIPHEKCESGNGFEYWECMPHEWRTATSLHKRGLVEFKDGEIPPKGEYFFARLGTVAPMRRTVRS